jgi:hypothetical protein
MFMHYLRVLLKTYSVNVKDRLGSTMLCRLNERVPARPEGQDVYMTSPYLSPKVSSRDYLPTQRSSRRCTLVGASTHDIVEHARPDLLDDADLLLDGFSDDGGHEVRDGVEVDAVGVAIV